MQQLTQQLKSGKMEILEVPFPILGEKQILVRNHYSCLSPGTEGKRVSDARKGYLSKAKARQKEVQLVIESIKTHGMIKTYNTVMNKLEAPSSLGYSCAGKVIAVGKNVSSFKVGDYVACGGQGAFHSEVVSVYCNLSVKVPQNVNLKYAAFTALASIAIQGIRQADLSFGENGVVIGLGIIGQLTMQLLESAGIKAIGVDINDQQVKLAKNAGAIHSFNRNQAGIEETINNLTDGFGADAVIITAGSSSLDPVEFAGAISRKKGKVVIVGSVPTGFSRKYYYEKELDLRMSSSYGPGRYDTEYEEKGIDYPIGYVRFTENRNMRTFIDLLKNNKLNLDLLILHKFSLLDAPSAYNLILEKSEPFAGILIEYNFKKNVLNTIEINQTQNKNVKLNAGVIGAGSFAQQILLPNLAGKFNLIGLSTHRGNNSIYVGKKYNFNYCSNDPDQVIKDRNISTVFIATRHNSHFEYVVKSLRAGKNVFVEKPLCTNEDELQQIIKTYNKYPNLIMVGFNRRFSPAIKKAKSILSEGQKKSINIRINAGILPHNHWVNDPEVGGGRIIGEACHFIDLAMYIAGSRISSVYANALDDCSNLNNTLNINLKFYNGSIANISYFSNGCKTLPKEYLEVFSNGTVLIIDDFQSMVVHSNKIRKVKFKGRDKGHKNEFAEFINSIESNANSPISLEDLYISTLATLKVNDSLKSKRMIEI